MYKRDIVNDLRQFTGAGMISRTELAKYLGYSRSDKVPNSYLEGLNRIGKKYFIIEVAERLNTEQRR